MLISFPCSCIENAPCEFPFPLLRNVQTAQRVHSAKRSNGQKFML